MLLCITSFEPQIFCYGLPLAFGNQAARLPQYSYHSGPSAKATNSTKGPTPTIRLLAIVGFLRRLTSCLIEPSTRPLPIACPRRSRAAYPSRLCWPAK